MRVEMGFQTGCQNDEVDLVFCECGRTIYLTKEELTPPITRIRCPECEFLMELITSGRYD